MKLGHLVLAITSIAALIWIALVAWREQPPWAFLLLYGCGAIATLVFLIWCEERFDGHFALTTPELISVLTFWPVVALLLIVAHAILILLALAFAIGNLPLGLGRSRTAEEDKPAGPSLEG